MVDLAEAEGEGDGLGLFFLCLSFFFLIYFLGGTGSRRTGSPNWQGTVKLCGRVPVGDGIRSCTLDLRIIKDYTHALNEQLL